MIWIKKTAMANLTTSHDRQIRFYLLVGFLAVVGLVGGAGGWAALASLNGAVIAPGVIAVDTSPKRIQHLEGGVVGAVAIREGDLVKEGDLLLRLDDTLTRANLAVVDGQLISLSARRARLDAERNDASSVAAPAAIAGRSGGTAVKAAFTGERNLFDARRRGREGKVAQLNERVRQTELEASGLTAQIDAKGGELALIGLELVDVEMLAAKGLVPAPRVTALRREKTRIEGERGQLVAEVARAKGRISETGLQILQVDQDLRTEIAKELRETEMQIAELTEKKVAAEDRLKRIEIRSPRAGYVNQLAVHTIGGVVASSEVLMWIVPKEDALTIEARIAPNDIDQMFIGQEAVVKFSGLNHRTTPELTGVVERIAADLTREKDSGSSYYAVRVKLPEDQLARLGVAKLIPGMQAEVFVQTSARTALNYMTKPLIDQFHHAMREE